MKNQLKFQLQLQPLFLLCIFIAAVFLFSGCYHAQVTTGLHTSSEVYERKWAPGFLFGLVGPDRIEGAQRCSTGGVAMVETRLSFLNLVASAITFGIYTPMHITITCANSSAGVIDGDGNDGVNSFFEAAGAEDVQGELRSGFTLHGR